MKILKYILLNLVLIFFLLLLTEIFIWHKENEFLQYFTMEQENYKKTPFHPGIMNFKLELDEKGRDPVGLEYKKKPIVLFGCSFTYGLGLHPDNVVSSILSRETKRPVYNRAFLGWGIQHMLYQTKIENLYETIPEPEYVIYIYIEDHIRRLYSTTNASWDILYEHFNLRYEEKNGKLVEVKYNNSIFNFIRRLYISAKIRDYNLRNYITNSTNDKQKYTLALNHFVEAKKEMKKHWKNTKYAIVMYERAENIREFIEELKKNDFLVLDIQDSISINLQTTEFLLSDNYHPNEKAWELVTPIIIREFKL